MPFDWKTEPDNLVVVTVSGELAKSEYDQVQSNLGNAIKSAGSISILIIIDDSFSGFEKAEGWGDVSAAEQNDAYIRKMAIVGDKQHKDMALVFTLKGLRPVPIEYFETIDAARAWLETE